MNCSSQENFLNISSDSDSYSRDESLVLSNLSSSLVPPALLFNASESRKKIPYVVNSNLIDSMGDEDESFEFDVPEITDKNDDSFEDLDNFHKRQEIPQETNPQKNVFDTTIVTLKFVVEKEIQDQEVIVIQDSPLVVGPPKEFTKPPLNKRQESTLLASASTDATSGETSKQVSSEEEYIEEEEEEIFKKRQLEDHQETLISTKTTQEDEPISDQVNIGAIQPKPSDQSKYKFVYYPLWRYCLKIMKGFMLTHSIQLCLFALDFPDGPSELMQQLPYADEEIKEIKANYLNMVSDLDFDLFNPEGLGSLFKAFAQLEEAFKIDISIFDAFKKQHANSGSFKKFAEKWDKKFIKSEKNVNGQKIVEKKIIGEKQFGVIVIMIWTIALQTFSQINSAEKLEDSCLFMKFFTELKCCRRNLAFLATHDCRKHVFEAIEESFQEAIQKMKKILNVGEIQSKEEEWQYDVLAETIQIIRGTKSLESFSQLIIAMEETNFLE